MDQQQEEAHREIAASPSDLQLRRKKEFERQGMKRDVCDGSTWQRTQGNTEKQIKTLLEDGTSCSESRRFSWALRDAAEVLA